MTKADRSELEDGNRPKAVVVGPDEGSRYWVAGGFDTIRLTGEQTGGALGVTETEETRGAAPPLHVHSREDETYDVVEGSFTFFIGDETIAATSGSLVFAPRGIPHTYWIDSPTGRYLCLIVPAGWSGSSPPPAFRRPSRTSPRRTRRTSTGSGTSRLRAE